MCYTEGYVLLILYYLICCFCFNCLILGKETIKKILSVGASHLSSLERTVNIKSVPQEITIQKRFSEQFNSLSCLS